jgi:uncharacterized SAM-binding protein YcdF (DUF218 family)
MLNHLNLDLVLSLLRPLFLPFNLKLLRRPFLDLLLDLLHNYCCLFFGVFLLNLLENLQSFMALFPICVEEKPFVVALKRIDFLFFK